MKIKLNNKSYKIKPAENLTVKEYRDFFSKFDNKKSSLHSVINYLSVVTGLEFGELSKINIDTKTLSRITYYIGSIRPINNLKSVEKFAFSGQIFEKNKLDWESVGVRLLMSENKSENVIELMTYLLAILIENNFDAEKVNEIYEQLLNENALSVLCFSTFFFQNLLNGLK